MFNMEFFMEELIPYWVHAKEDENVEKVDTDTTKKKQAILDHRRIHKLNNSGSSNTFAIVIGLLFVAAVGGLAAYQSFQSDSNENSNEGEEYSHVRFQKLSDLVKDVPVSSKSFGRAMLPDHVAPIKYLLYLHPNMTAMNYTGLVKIRVQCLQTTQKIYLHSIKHKIHKIAIKTVNLTDIEDILITEHFYHEQTEMLILTLNQNLIQSYEYDFYLGFAGNISTHKSEGMFLSTYQNADGLSHPMLMTDFKPKFARKIFPCFDEPRFKAHFQIILAHHKQFSAYSNAPIKSLIPITNSDEVETHFNLSKDISTHHVTFVVSTYVMKNTVSDKTNVQIGLLSPTDRSEELTYASTIVYSMLKHFQSQFKMKYSFAKLGKERKQPSVRVLQIMCSRFVTYLPNRYFEEHLWRFAKLDLTPATRITTDISETVGLVHMYEPRLLYDVKKNSLQDMENVALSVSGAVLEQWIGGLVTTRTWHDEWLISSLIVFLKYDSLANAFEGDKKSMFYDTVINQALLTQANPFAMSITRKTTEKGAGVLYMFASWLGKERFYNVIQEYVEKFKYGNAAYEDFWSIFKKNFGVKDRVGYLSGWTTRSGFPVLTIQPYENATFLVVKQSRYKYNNISELLANGNNVDEMAWVLPLFIKFSCDSQDVSAYLMKATPELIPNLCWNDTSKWYKANWGANGFYRVNYNKQNWDNLWQQLRKDHTIFSAVDRTNLITDIFELSYSNHVTIGSALDFTSYLDNETCYFPYAVALKYLNRIENNFKDTKVEACMKNYILKKTRKTLKSLKAKETLSHDETKLLILLTEIELPDNKRDSIVYDNEFLKWLISTERDTVDGAWRELVFKIGIQRSSHYEFDALLKYYRRAFSVAERALVIKTLASSIDESLLKELKDVIFDESVIFADDRLKTLIYMCKNPLGNPIAWKFLRENWNTLYNDDMKENFSGMDTVITSCLSNLKSQQRLTELAEFIKDHNVGAFQNLFLQMEYEIKLNILYTERVNEVVNWFQDYDPQCLS